MAIEVENIRSNAKVYMDSMYIEASALLHIVDDAMRFSAALFDKPPTPVSIWESILSLLATVYTVLPNILVFDDGSQFKDTFVEICEIYDV